MLDYRPMSWGRVGHKLSNVVDNKGNVKVGASCCMNKTTNNISIGDQCHVTNNDIKWGKPVGNQFHTSLLWVLSLVYNLLTQIVGALPKCFLFY
jgi:hypothetical protein